jgi:hypothetical protein
LLCLIGWNRLIAGCRPWARLAAMGAIGATAIAYYIVEPLHWRIFPLQRACEYVAKNDLLASAPMIIFGDPMAQATLHLAPNPPNLVLNDCNPAIMRQHLLQAPLGSVGLWDNQHGQAWFGVTVAELPALGYRVLYQAQTRPPFDLQWQEPTVLPREQMYVVIRKERAGELK